MNRCKQCRPFLEEPGRDVDQTSFNQFVCWGNIQLRYGTLGFPLSQRTFCAHQPAKHLLRIFTRFRLYRRLNDTINNTCLPRCLAFVILRWPVSELPLWLDLVARRSVANHDTHLADWIGCTNLKWQVWHIRMFLAILVSHVICKLRFYTLKPRDDNGGNVVGLQVKSKC